MRYAPLRSRVWLLICAGLMYAWNLKPPNWMGIQFVDVQGGVIIDNTTS